MKNLYIYVALASSLLVFAISYFVVLSKLIVTKKNLSKIYVDNFALEQYIKLLQDSKSNSTDQEVHKENFLKFLSDSRDWAFAYIEDVQSGLTEFVEDVKPEIEYFKEYGDIISMQPNYYSMKKIAEAYDKLIKLLPKEEEEIK
jgi:hypothetical protein